MPHCVPQFAASRLRMLLVRCLLPVTSRRAKGGRLLDGYVHTLRAFSDYANKLLNFR